MPLGPDIGDNIRELKRAHPEWAEDRIRAAAIRAAQEAKSRSGSLNKKGLAHGRAG